MDPAYFETVCQQLPNPVVFKLLGGEPTLHPRFFDFIKIARKYGHHVYFSSNGIKYTNPVFMEKLQKLQVQFSPGLTMNGGYSRDDVYGLIDNRRCLAQKLAALEALRSYGIGRVALSAIVVRGMNEYVVGELLELADRYSDIVRYVHFRSAAKVARWVDTEPYRTAELKELLSYYVDPGQALGSNTLEHSCDHRNDRDCCDRISANRLLQVGLIEFASEKSERCPIRGKLMNNTFTIQPFFENMIRAGDSMAAEFGEVVFTEGTEALTA